jgi:hypothetical protein
MQIKKATLPRIPIESIWVIVVLVGIFAFANTHPIRPHDFWFHVAVGREIVSTGHIPDVDTFSYTALGQPYDSYKSFWLMEVFYYGLLQATGAVGIVLAHGLTIAGAYTILLLACWRATGNWRIAALGTLFAAALGINDWNVRPQAITFLIGALYLLAIVVLEHQGKFRWVLVFPLGMIVWVNSHGTYVLGLVLVGAWLAAALIEKIVSRRWQNFPLPLPFRPVPKIWSALLLTGAACLLNPRGLGVLRYIFGMATNPVIQNLVPEWAPPTFGTLRGQLFFAGLLFAAIVLIFSPHRPDLLQIFLFIGFGALGLKTLRGSIWFGLVMAPTVSLHMAAWGRRVSQRLTKLGEPQKPSPIWVNWVFVIFLLGFGALSLPWFKESLPFPPAKAGLISYETPVKATETLLSNQWPGRIFHAMSFGSYLDWAAQPAYPVFVDSRIELYSESVWRDYLKISAAQPGWMEKLEAYNVEILMLSPSEQPMLIAAAEDSPRWQRVYADDVAVIFLQHSN